VLNTTSELQKVRNWRDSASTRAQIWALFSVVKPISWGKTEMNSHLQYYDNNDDGGDFNT